MTAARSSGGAKTLPAEYYTSEEVYRLEARQIFQPGWQCVLHASEISEAGAVQVISHEGESLLLVRGEDGRARCFFNVCRHRGTRLCDTASSRLRRAVTCPYHGWSYDLSGQCLAAPNMPDEFRKQDWPLKQVAVAERFGYLFLTEATVPASVESAFGPLLPRLDDWSMGDLLPAARLEYLVRANWKLLFQNYNECYHCPRVHPALNALSSFQTAGNDFDEGPVLGGPMRLSDGVESMTTSGHAIARCLPNLPEDDRRRVYYFTVFPTLFISPHPDYVLVHRLQRVSVEETRVVCEFLFHPDAMDQADFDPTPAVEFWDTTNRQDWHVCELSQQGVMSRGYEPGPYSDLECTLAAFDRFYLQQMERTTP